MAKKTGFFAIMLSILIWSAGVALAIVFAVVLLRLLMGTESSPGLISKFRGWISKRGEYKAVKHRAKAAAKMMNEKLKRGEDVSVSISGDDVEVVSS